MDALSTSPRTLVTVPRPSARQRAEAALSVVTPLAWGGAALAVVALVFGWITAWEELVVGGISVLVLLLVAVAFTLVRARLDVEVRVRPSRVTAGERSAAAVTVGSSSGQPMLAVDMELQVGDGVAEFRVPNLGAGATHEEIFLLPTRRRAVIPVGPATSVRGDPLGLLRRVKAWTEPEPLFVHPLTVPLAELGTGLIRDLEGKATADASPADVAFSTLRAYEPGDDRRFVHWLTTARTGELMVRQFVDTRRSHVGVVVDGAEDAYGDDDQLELAVSAAASLGLRVQQEQQELSMVVGGARIPTGAGGLMLDHLSAVEPSRGRSTLGGDVDHLLRVASGLTLAMVVTGSEVGVDDVRSVAARFPADVRVIVLQAVSDDVAALRPLGPHALLRLGHLEGLPRLLWRAAS